MKVLRRMLTGLLALLLILLAAVVALRLLFPLPSRDGIAASQVLPTPPAATLGIGAARAAKEQPGLTGIYLLDNAHDAFVARAALARVSQRTIDAQYYIWHADISGRMLLSELVRAADRGVRVRLLIDDNTTAGTDPVLLAADSHPNVEVRLFNPLPIRRVRVLGYAAGFPRINHRMHNKSFIADGAAAVVGGRNVGDEYFGAESDGLFIDLDAVAVGAVMPAVNTTFDRYWNSAAAYPIDRLADPATAIPLAQVRDFVAPPEQAARAQEYNTALMNSPLVKAMTTDGVSFAWSPVTLWTDPPEKALERVPYDDQVIAKLVPLLEGAQRSIDLVSGYFVPAQQGTDLLSGLARRGVATTVVTNSFAVTDVPAVHAGYAKRRPALLDAGVHLYELRKVGDAPVDTPAIGSVTGSLKASGGGESLHAKTFVIDSARLFVGSFNLDPRSVNLNCEMGFLIDNPELAVLAHRRIHEEAPVEGWLIGRDAGGALTWTHGTPPNRVTTTEEPDMSWGDHAFVTVLSWLPIEWLL